jgi:hypothetical protein
MFGLFYKKNDNSALFKEFGENNLKDIQNYIPIYKKFFKLGEKNYKSINLNQPFHITSVEKTDQINKYTCSVKSDASEKKLKTFFKFSPLIDPIKYMVGKYGNITNKIRTALPKLENNSCHAKVLDPNNAAYVDGFFTYLTSNLLHTHNFIHGVDFFGSFLAIQENFQLNIFDDLEYLTDSEYFHKHKGKLFDIDATHEDMFFEGDTRNYKKKIQISKKISNKSICSLNDDIFDGVFRNTKEVVSPIKLTESLIFEFNLENKKIRSTPCSTNSTCSSRSSHTSSEDSEQDSAQDDCSDESYDSTTDSDIICAAVIKDFPVQIICLECLENTLDSLLQDELSVNEWKSCLFQTIMTLISYQKMFNFTHNDLHTNNIMFNATDKQFIFYRYNKTYYKVPTYGRLFKIIDFGRSIYTYKDKLICSDSFHSKGDAATQYNCEPYINKNKARLEPNYSFDLCRLGCSLYDYFIDDIEVKTNPIATLISDWCKDDKGRNILYKKCGEERYPEFKLYKMIARTVHNHTPQNQIKNVIFSEYISSKKKVGKRKMIDIDTLPIYT